MSRSAGRSRSPTPSPYIPATPHGPLPRFTLIRLPFATEPRTVGSTLSAVIRQAWDGGRLTVRPHIGRRAAGKADRERRRRRLREQVPLRLRAPFEAARLRREPRRRDRRRLCSQIRFARHKGAKGGHPPAHAGGDLLLGTDLRRDGRRRARRAAGCDHRQGLSPGAAPERHLRTSRRGRQDRPRARPSGLGALGGAAGRAPPSCSARASGTL